MNHAFSFTFKKLEDQLMRGLHQGYTYVSCQTYCHQKSSNSISRLTVVCRVDIDVSCKKAKRLVEIFNKLGIQATFFVRLHAPEYNPFDFENYLILKFIRDSGHEIGYHSEVIDQSVIWDEDPEICLKRDVDLLNRALDIQIAGTASHGGMTGLNNLDFWKTRKPSEFGLLYEGYDKEPTFNLFDTSFYISDSCWTYWKCYNNGVLVEGERKTFGDHLEDRHPLIYLLVHPDTYYDDHIYE